MSALGIRPAKRSEAKPLVGLYAESGNGKTKSALLLARGFVGPKGKIVMIETESGRGEVFADELPGGYDVIPIRESFAPRVYGEAIALAERSGADALIIDSASHEWEGVGGVLAMAAENQAKGFKGPRVWQQPKIDHGREFILRLMQTPIALVVVCMRAKYPMVYGVNPATNKKEWHRSGDLRPKQSEDILYEMQIHGWIDDAHRFIGTKYTREDQRAAIPSGEVITIDTGKRLAEWARGDAPATPPALERALEAIAAAKSAQALAKAGEDLKAMKLQGAELRRARAAFKRRQSELAS